MSSYENKRWVTDEHGREVLVEIPEWQITQLLTVHSLECRVVEELRRSVGRYPVDRRLELAREAACTCGSFERKPVPSMKPTSPDKRDNRDPELVGREHLISKGEHSWQTNGSSTPGPTGPAS